LNIYSPYVNWGDLLFTLINCFPNNTANPVCLPWFSFSNSMNRASLLENIVNDTNTYTGLPQANDYMAKEFAYKKLDESPAYLSMNTVDDTKYNMFYNKHKIKNIGKFDKVNKHIRNQNFQAALSINNTIVAENQIEINRKKVNRMYLESIIYNIKLNNTDSMELVNIAWQDPKYNGDAVFSARVILGIDPDINTISYTVPFKHLSESLSDNQVIVYPNPASDKITLQFTDVLATNAVFVLYGIMGNLIFSSIIEVGNYERTFDISKV